MLETISLDRIFGQLTDSFACLELQERPFTASYEDADALWEALRGQTWDSASPSLLEQHFDAIHYVQTPRFGEMLPFFVAAAVSNFESTPRLRAALLVRLTRDSAEPERFERSMQSLCPKQRAAVVSTLGYLLGVIRKEQSTDGPDWIDSRDNPVRPALQSFWT